MLLPDERTLKPAKSPVLAPSPLLTKPASTPRVHSTSAPTSAYQEYRQGERESSPASNPKPSVHPHLPSGHISSPPRPAVRKESEWSAADEKTAIHRAQTKLETFTPAKPSKPLGTHEDDARETRRLQNQNQVSAARQSSPPKPAPGTAGDLAAATQSRQEAVRNLEAAKSLPASLNRGGIRQMEIRDAQSSLSAADARQKSATAEKGLEAAKSLPASLNRGGRRQEEINYARQAASSARTAYLGSQGLDSSGKPIVVTPPKPPAPDKPKEKSFLDKAINWGEDKAEDATKVVSEVADKGLDFAKAYGNFQKDFDVGAAKAAWDMGKGIYSLGKAGVEFQYNAVTNPKKAEQTLVNLGRNTKYVVQHPGQVWNAVKDPYVQAWKSGHPGEAFGRGFVDVGSLFIPGGGIVAKVGKGAKAVEVAAKAEKGTEVVTEVTGIAARGEKGVAVAARSERGAAAATARGERAAADVGSAAKAEKGTEALPTAVKSISRKDNKPFRNSQTFRSLLKDMKLDSSEVVAGHGHAVKSGRREMLGMEDATLSQEKKTETRRFIEYKGSPLEVETAKKMELTGQIPKGTVASARSDPGWTRSEKINPRGIDVVKGRFDKDQVLRLREISRDQLSKDISQAELRGESVRAQRLQDQLSKDISQAELRGESVQSKPINWRSSKDRNLHEHYHQTLRDSAPRSKTGGTPPHLDYTQPRGQYNQSGLLAKRK